jgi:hypothetical protein
VAILNRLEDRLGGQFRFALKLLERHRFEQGTRKGVFLPWCARESLTEPTQTTSRVLDRSSASSGT